MACHKEWLLASVTLQALNYYQCTEISLHFSSSKSVSIDILIVETRQPYHSKA